MKDGASGQWVLLAAAICKSGIESCDETFLSSTWYSNLREVVIDYIREREEKMKKETGSISELV